MKEFTFKLTEEEANIVLMGLQEIPFKLAVRVINKLQSQAKESEQTEPKGE